MKIWDHGIQGTLFETRTQYAKLFWWKQLLYFCKNLVLSNSFFNVMYLLMVVIIYFLWYIRMHNYFDYLLYLSLYWAHSLHPPSLRCWLLHKVDKAMACSCAVFLVTSEIHQSSLYYEKRWSQDRKVNPRPLDWQASMLTARPCHFPRNNSFSVMSILTNVLVMFNFSKIRRRFCLKKNVVWKHAKSCNIEKSKLFPTAS